jgi:hypothetical protein
MTSFQGAADASSKGPGKISNSVFIPVVNMPLPTTTVSVAGQNVAGWVNSPSTATANFTANIATYPSSGTTIPQSNTFTPAPIYSVAAGFSTWPNLPDTTYPVATDYIMSNTATSPTTPFCQVNGTTPLTPFTPSASFTNINSGSVPSDGIYNLHYFPTDCAFTEGLFYNPTPSQVTDPTANWASFPFVTVGVDTLAPQYSCNSPSAPSSGWFDSNVSVSCTVTDQNWVQGVSASGFTPLVDGIQGSQTETVVISTAGNATPNAISTVNAGPVQACDLAGNCVSVSAGPFNVSLSPPLTITASSGTMQYGGTPPVITPIYGGLVNGEAAPTTPPTCSTSATSTSPVGNYQSTCSGASDSIYGYSFVYAVGNVSVTAVGASISLTNLAQTYTGSSLSPTVTTVPPGLSYSLTGGGDTNAGSYQVSATITNPDYSGSTSNTFVISPANASISLTNLSQTYTGSPLSPTVTTVPNGLSYLLTGAPDTAQGSYNVSATITNKNYTGSTSGMFNITAPPVWTITPSPYNFGSVSIGQTVSQPFTIYNPGPNSASIVVSIPENGYSGRQPVGDPGAFHIIANNCRTPVPSGGTCTVTVSYTADPNDFNGAYAYLTVCDHGTDVAKATMLGKAVNPAVTLSTKSFNFGSQTTGSPDTQAVVELTNSGPTTLLLHSIYVSGSVTFKLASGANQCISGGSLASGSSCYLYVTFTPAHKGTTYYGNLTVNGNAVNLPQTVALTGKAD